MVRRTRQRRCGGCGLIPARCLCATLPRVRLPFRLVLLQHPKEGGKPTNTGRLLERVVEGCERLVVASRAPPWPEEAPGGPVEERWLLFPDVSARVAEPAALRDWLARRACLVVVDATWRGAARIAARTRGVRELPRVALPAGTDSCWPIRRAPRPGQLCTFESVVRFAGLLPDPAPAAALAAAWERIVADAVSASRGRLASARLAPPAAPSGGLSGRP